MQGGAVWEIPDEEDAGGHRGDGAVGGNVRRDVRLAWRRDGTFPRGESADGMGQGEPGDVGSAVLGRQAQGRCARGRARVHRRAGRVASAGTAVGGRREDGPGYLRR